LSKKIKEEIEEILELQNSEMLLNGFSPEPNNIARKNSGTNSSHNTLSPNSPNNRNSLLAAVGREITDGTIGKQLNIVRKQRQTLRNPTHSYSPSRLSLFELFNENHSSPIEIDNKDLELVANLIQDEQKIYTTMKPTIELPSPLLEKQYPKEKNLTESPITPLIKQSPKALEKISEELIAPSDKVIDTLSVVKQLAVSENNQTQEQSTPSTPVRTPKKGKMSFLSRLFNHSQE
jgi:hypothetical protein